MIFRLTGEVRYRWSRYDLFRAKIEKQVNIIKGIAWATIKRQFEAPNIANGIAKAKKIVAEYHRKYYPKTDYVMTAMLWHDWDETPSWPLTRKVWETEWKEARGYVPPRPAIPGRTAGFQSRRIK